MSNTIKIVHRFQFLRESVRAIDVPQTEFSITTTSELAVVTNQLVGTTHEALALGDVTDTATAIIENTHATATISVGSDSAGSFVKWFDIAPGDPPGQMPRVGTLASVYLKSSEANTPVRVTLAKIA